MGHLGDVAKGAAVTAAMMTAGATQPGVPEAAARYAGVSPEVRESLVETAANVHEAFDEGLSHQSAREDESEDTEGLAEAEYGEHGDPDGSDEWAEAWDAWDMEDGEDTSDAEPGEANAG